MTRKLLTGLGALISVAVLCIAVAHIYSDPARSEPLPRPSPIAARGWIDVEDGLLNIQTPLNGSVTVAHAAEGDHVQRGQVLAELNDTQLRIQLRMASAEVAQANAQLDSASARLPMAITHSQRLLEAAQDGVATGAAADEARVAVEIARAELHASQANAELLTGRRQEIERQLESTRIRAPKAGRIIRRSVNNGDLVDPGAASSLYQLLPDGPQIVRAEVDENFVDQLTVGMPALITLESQAETRRAARLLRISPVQGKGSSPAGTGDRFDGRSIECVLSLDGPPLRIGQRVVVRFGQ